jgi:hypothetical protein
MTGGQHGTELCWHIDFKGLIPVEKDLRAAIAVGKLCGKTGTSGGKNGGDPTRVGYYESACFRPGRVCAT